MNSTNDLIFAMVTMGIAAIAAGVIASTKQVAGKLQQGQSMILALTVVVVGMFTFLFYAAGRMFWARFIEDSAVIVWSNFTPLFAAVSAGLVFRLPKTPLWRRILLFVSLSIAAVLAVLWPFLNIWLRPPLPAGNEVHSGVTMQTAWATCSPAAASTFLRAGGIEVTEGDLIPLCLTDRSGTPTLGLYRGLKLAANANQRDVEAVSMTHEELASNQEWPLLITVQLPASGVENPSYEEDWGWIPGLGHSVVVFGRIADTGHYRIGDPSIGAELWTSVDMQVLWHGDAIRFKGRSR
ncbi:hypothetical protein Q31b_00210 [Novipirellula aureliae]|uniref:Peptidase C39 family protein n=1 Tax=Novipirellula aureliae TaxID=2527966 RepID=A0A5C6EAU2_9BACT|nr:peptidase C39 [Novipirellula aureliae]TWU44851.1 hypothetical protein Q31b_00210 [Novipirellula aureliae]